MLRAAWWWFRGLFGGEPEPEPDPYVAEPTGLTLERSRVGLTLVASQVRAALAASRTQADIDNG